MKKGTYIGFRKDLKGKTAYVREHTSVSVEIQLDDMAFHALAHGWHAFPKTDWRVDDE